MARRDGGRILHFLNGLPGLPKEGSADQPSST
jgi:hypothetical protein